MRWFSIIAFLIGPIALIVWLIYYSITRQKKINKAIKSKQINIPYSRKLPLNYTLTEKRWALLTAIALLVNVTIASIFYFALKSLFLASLTIVIGIIVWKAMIGLGDKVTKRK